MALSNLNQALNHLNLSTINVMQILVLQEVNHQLKELSPNQAEYIKPVEVITYALNRLPSLYASSKEGLCYQLKQAQEEYKPQILQAVRQGIAAVQRDPLRRSTPLMLNKQPKSNKKQALKRVKPQGQKGTEIANQTIHNVHSINSHADYCQMALELATA
ncbi:MAG: late competence development ComFB family protein [Cyanobacteriota bacterium]|nr:late competence development ComFB family protein [Cyanobacteriota bacterium]